VNESRGLACELVAWEFLTCLSERELMDHLLYELPEATDSEQTTEDVESRSSAGPTGVNDGVYEVVDDETPLLQHHGPTLRHVSRPPRRAAASSDTYRADTSLSDDEKVEDATRPLAGLNALEIAAVASAKKFLSQRLVQKVVQDIWDGNIIFWESLSVNAVKKACVYNKR
jgi:hypothetical protein